MIKIGHENVEYFNLVNAFLVIAPFISFFRSLYSRFLLPVIFFLAAVERLVLIMPGNGTLINYRYKGPF